jgi:hypothetical protein
LYLLFAVAAKAGADLNVGAPETALIVLGALVFVTTVVSGIDYVVVYTRKAIEASRQQRGLA